MKIFSFIMFLVFGFSLYNFWCGKNCWNDYKYYQEKIREKEISNQALVERNNTMSVEIEDLKHSYESIEETARRELGYIKSGETYVRIIDETSE